MLININIRKKQKLIYNQKYSPLYQINRRTFAKWWTKIQGQVVNPWHQTLQGQSVTKPETPSQIMQVGDANQINESSGHDNIFNLVSLKKV